MKPLPNPTADPTLPVLVEPIAARLLKGAQNVVVETAVAFQVAFGADRRTALNAVAAASAAARLVTAAHGPAIVPGTFR